MSADRTLVLKAIAALLESHPHVGHRRGAGADELAGRILALVEPRIRANERARVMQVLGAWRDRNAAKAVAHMPGMP